MKKPETNIVVAGFGGQGVLFLGTILAQAALIEGKNTTWIPSYGAEMRGGSANCYVVISDEEIPSPIFDRADIAVFLSKAAKDKFEKTVETNGLIIANSSMTGATKERADANYLFEPLTDIVSKNKGLLLNIVALGVLVKKTGGLKKESVIEALKQISSAKKPEFLKFNLESFETGYSLETLKAGA